MTAPVVAEVCDLRVHFTVGTGRHRALARAVDGVNLIIREREIVALVGESGCGKTTVARTIMRLQDATAGTVTIDGVDVTNVRGRRLRRLRRTFQMIFQDPFESLPSNATALGVVAEGLRIHQPQLSADQRRAAAITALDSCGLAPAATVAGRRIFALSGGQRQRVAIAAALAVEPRLLVADEPVSMLDVSLRAGIIRVLLDLRERIGVATLFITHDLALAGVLADRIAVLYLGKVVEEGPAGQVIAHPGHPYTRALVEVMPKPGGLRRSRTLLTGEPPNTTDASGGCRFAPRCPLRRELGDPQRCLSEEPALRIAQDSPEDPGGTHRVACHFP